MWWTTTYTYDATKLYRLTNIRTTASTTIENFGVGGMGDVELPDWVFKPWQENPRLAQAIATSDIPTADETPLPTETATTAIAVEPSPNPNPSDSPSPSLRPFPSPSATSSPSPEATSTPEASTNPEMLPVIVATSSPVTEEPEASPAPSPEAALAASEKDSAITTTNGEIRVTIGGHTPGTFIPKATLERWKEVALDVMIPATEGASTDAITQPDGKTVWHDAEKQVRFYELPASSNLPAGGYEIDMVYGAKPASNIITLDIDAHGLEFFYQPPLDQEPHDANVVSCQPTECLDAQGNVAIERPEEVVGSYAVYYQEKKSGDYSLLGGNDYRTGKAFHLYRPKITDNAGKSTWGDLHIDIDTGTLTITVPQEFLDTATYPITVDPTFGYGTIGGTSSGWSTGTIGTDGKYYIPATNGTVNSIFMYGAASAGSVNVQTALYKPNDTLLDNSSAVSFSTSLAWWELPMHNPTVTANGGGYNLAFNPAGSIVRYYDTGQGTPFHKENTSPYGTWPNPITWTTKTGQERWSLYASYSPATTTVATSTIQDISYIYDNVGNITQVTDHSDTGAAKSITYGYDDLNRLTSASTTAASSTPYSRTYTYSSIGNILTTSDLGTYAYDGTNYANPHAATSIAGSGGAGAITLDGTVQSATSTGSFTRTVTISSNSNRLLLVTFATHQSGGDATSMTYNGTSLTKIKSQVGSFGETVSIWTLVAPSTGSNTLQVNAPANDFNAIGIYSLYNVKQSNPSTTAGASGSNSTASVSITPPSNNNWVIDVVEAEPIPTVGAGQTQDWLLQGSQVYMNGGGSHVVQTTAAAQTMQWSLSYGERWNLAAVAIEPAGTTTSLTYDNNGNVTAYGSNTYNWNYRNQITQAGTGTATSSYGYDYQGNRVDQTVGGVTTRYANKLYSTNGATTTKYIYAGDTLIATVEKIGTATTTHIIHTDHLGGMNVVTDADGTIVQTTDYYPYGSLRINSRNTVLDEKRKFIGEQYDSEVGLNYLNARYYDGSRGQFISEDPTHLAIGDPTRLQAVTGVTQNQILSDPQILNSYSYGQSNPIRFKDPKGTCPFCPILIGAGIGAIGGIGVQAYNDYFSGEYSQRSWRETFSTYSVAAGQGSVVGAGATVAGALAFAGGFSTIGSAITVGGTSGILTAGTTVVGNRILGKRTDPAGLAVSTVMSTLTAGVLDTAPKIPGRLPNFGTRAFYTGAHTTRQAVGEFVSDSAQVFGQTAAQTYSTYSGGTPYSGGTSGAGSRSGLIQQLQSLVTALQSLIASLSAPNAGSKR